MKAIDLGHLREAGQKVDTPGPAGSILYLAEGSAIVAVSGPAGDLWRCTVIARREIGRAHV